MLVFVLEYVVTYAESALSLVKWLAEEKSNGVELLTLPFRRHDPKCDCLSGLQTVSIAESCTACTSIAALPMEEIFLSSSDNE